MYAVSLHDVTHNSSYSEGAVSAWRKAIVKGGKNRFPDLKKNDNLNCLIRHVGIWEPIAMFHCVVYVDSALKRL